MTEPETRGLTRDQIVAPAPMTLRDVRLALGMTQADIAERWGRTQPQVVRLEKTDLDTAKLGTIRSFVEAMGGTCTIHVEINEQIYEL